MVTSASGNCCSKAGVSSFALGHCFRPGIQSVRCSRAGYLPVMMLARVGEQTGQAAYPLVNRTPRGARRSTLGVS